MDKVLLGKGPIEQAAKLVKDAILFSMRVGSL